MSVITGTRRRAIDLPRGHARPDRVALHPVSDQTTRRAWAAYVENAAGGTLFHHPDWCENVQAVFGHRPLHHLALRGGRVVGVLPLMEVRSWLAGTLLVSVPYATYGGILGDDPAARQALAREAMRLADSRGARSLQLRSRTADVPGLTTDDRYASFTRRLPLRVDELGGYLPRKARAAARRACEREKLSVQHDASLLPMVWQLYARSMRRLASLNYPHRFFEALRARLGRRAWVTVVRRAERPLAGLLSFVFGDTVYPYFVGMDERLRCTGAGNLLYLSVMERAVRSGLRWFDFGRSRRDNVGSFDFKRNQGFEPQVLGYQCYLPAGRTAPDLTPANPRFALARRLWPRLPLTCTKPLGCWLSKSIPG